MNIHLSEIILILLVALLVIKPQRLPQVAYVLGKWVKWLSHVINKAKNELKSYD